MPWKLLAALLALVILGAPAHADGPCASPRAAADALATWTRTAQFDPAKAAACMDVPPGADAGQLAIQLQQVLDGRGLWLPVPSLSDDPAWTDDRGRSAVTPLPEALPELVIARGADGQWRFARHTMEAVPNLYASTFSTFGLWLQSALPDALKQRVLGVYPWQILYAVLLVLAALVIGTVARLLLRTQVKRLVARSRLHLDEKVYARTNGPLVALITFAVLRWGIADLGLPLGATRAILGVLDVALVLSTLATLYRFINAGSKVAQNWATTTDNRLDDQLVPMLTQAVRVVVLVIGALYLADAIGIDVWKLVAGVSLGGLAFALAAQDTVANLFGSLNIFVDRPFQIGDAVTIGSVSGTVEEVGFRSTRVRTAHNSVVTIPNSQITNASVDNMGLRSRRRVNMTLGLTYDTPVDRLEAFVEGVRAILAAHPLVEQSWEVHVHGLGPSSVDVFVNYHIATRDGHEELRTRGQNVLEFLRLAESLGVSFAFPSSSLYLESTPSEPLRAAPPATLAELGALADSFGPGGERARPLGPAFATTWNAQDLARRTP